MPEAHIAGYGSALPWPMTTERYLEVDREARLALGQDEHIANIVQRIASNSRIRTRHVVSPVWLEEDDRPDDVDDIFTAHEFDPPGNARARFWKDAAPRLAIDAARNAIEHWGG